jgi:hypothetical protein
MIDQPAGGDLSATPPVVAQGAQTSNQWNREVLIRESWDQGAILGASALCAAATTRGGRTADRVQDLPWTGAVVIGHGCDVINPSCELEPTLEVLPYNAVSRAANTECLFAQHPRLLEFMRGEETWTFDIQDRLFLDRQRLLLRGEKPIGVLEAVERRVLVEWVRRRYDRVVLPESFAKRFAHKRVRDALFRKRDSFGRVLISLDPWAEVASGEDPYEVGLRIILRPGFSQLQMYTHRQVSDLLRALLSHLVNAPGVCVTGVDEWPAPERQPTSLQVTSAWETIVRRPEQITIAELLGFHPFHAESLANL